MTMAALAILRKCEIRHVIRITAPTLQRLCYFNQRRSHTGGISLNYESARYELQQKLKKPQYFNLVKDIIGPWMNKKPDHLAVLLTDGTSEVNISYQALYDQAVALATALSDPTPPKCALVVLPKVPEWWVINVAGSWCGTVISPGTSLLSPSDVVYRLAQCEADCIMCDVEMAAKIDDATQSVPVRVVVNDRDEDVRPGWLSFHHLLEYGRNQTPKPCVKTKADDVAQLFFTSGTTGRPKMVPHTQASYGVGHIVASRYWLDLNDDDMLWNISDTGWAKAAWSSLYNPFLAGATAFVHQMQKFEAEEALTALCRYPVSVLCAPPTAYRAFLQCDLSKYRFHSLRHCVSAGEPLNPEVMQIWHKHTGLHIFEGYGQSETTLLCGVFKGVKLRPGSMGKAAPGYTLKVLDNQQQELPPHQEGVLAVSLKDGYPVGLFKGYVSGDKQTSDVFIGDYYVTGDKGYYDEDDYFWFVGRSDDVIISSGYRIGPFEVESVLLEHPAVAESAVVSSPDELRGEVVKAFVVLAPEYECNDEDALKKELQEYVKTNTAPYKYPRKVEFCRTLPKTISGKIRRVELRNQEWKKV